MIPTPTNMLPSIESSPQQWEITVYNDDYSKEVTDKCSFEFVISPPESIKLVKNKIVIDKKATRFSSQILVTYGKEKKFINFTLN